MNVDVTIYEVSVSGARVCVHSAFLKHGYGNPIPNAKREQQEMLRRYMYNYNYPTYWY